MNKNNKELQKALEDLKEYNLQLRELAQNLQDFTNNLKQYV